MQRLIEVEAHQLLQQVLRSQEFPGQPQWPHHLTMTRLVARALRLGRSALVQTGISPRNLHHSYRLSYLVPLLTWPKAVILVAPDEILDVLLQSEIRQVCHCLQNYPPYRSIDKRVQRGEHWPGSEFRGVFLTSPEAWLDHQLQQDSEFPAHIPTLIDSADDLEAWIHQKLTVCLQSRDWHDLIQTRPTQAETIRSAQARLTRQVFQHPPNPYNCHLLDGVEQEILQQLYEDCFNLNRNGHHLPESQSEAWEQFWQHWHRANQLRWVDIHRSQGSFSLYCSPLEMTETLQHIWARQPVVLVGGALDLEKSAPIYRHNIGLEDVTCVKFSPDRQNQLIQLYLPSGLPLPNTPRFHAALMEAIRTLLWTSTGASNSNQLTVLLIDDLPLKAQMGASLAAEFGSRVKVETLDLAADSILVTGWQFWQSMQGKLPCPHLLAIATLPLPSLENPLVAGQVSHYKQQRQDWFRLYLLPTALNQLQRAIAPVRETQGVVALFDGRVLHRSYGQQVLAALSPFARVHYLDTIWFDRI